MDVKYIPRPVSSGISATVFLVLFALVLNIPAYGEDTLTGSFTNDLYLNPQTSSLITYRSDLDVTYYLKEMKLSSSSVFTEDAYRSQKFGLDYSLGLVDTYSTFSYDPDNSRINYFKGEADTVFSGVGIENTFVLEYLEEEEAYGSGYELILYGKIPNGPSLYVDNLFGMEDNEAELLGLVDGTGYTIWTDDGTYGPSQWQYVSTTVELTNIDFSCCSFTSTTKLSEEKGFEHTTLEFDIEEKNFPLKLDGEVKFSPQTKSVKLHPRVDLGWACLDVYTDLTTPDDENALTGDTDTLGGLLIKGFGITDVKLGNVRLSSLTALHENLFRLSTEKNIDLHASDYVLSPDPVYSGLYVETAYDEITSIVADFNEIPLTVGADVYFYLNHPEYFGFGLFTGTARYDVSDQFSLGVGVEVAADALKQVRFGFDYYF